MISLSEVNAKIDSLKAYSVSQNATTETLFTPLYTATTSYFQASTDISSQLREVIKYMYNDIYRRNVVYQYNYDVSLPTDYPTGYTDIRECFYTFSALMSISNETFYTGFVFSSSGTSQTAVSNSYIDSWVAEIGQAHTTESSNLAALADWCKNSEGDSDLISVVEDRGTITSSLTMKQIATMIYIDRYAKEIITEKSLTTYIPSYLKG